MRRSPGEKHHASQTPYHLNHGGSGDRCHYAGAQQPPHSNLIEILPFLSDTEFGRLCAKAIPISGGGHGYVSFSFLFYFIFYYLFFLFFLFFFFILFLFFLCGIFLLSNKFCINLQIWPKAIHRFLKLFFFAVYNSKFVLLRA
eukprot:Phypoly_transcript_11706.p1 GENE.Phypoly_transcript_11706~~Phypoly_transcript_11706.p1  ORF type:complete len:143 (-),score=9.44 Phypoly_transcript_11706:567-995(-)